MTKSLLNVNKTNTNIIYMYIAFCGIVIIIVYAINIG